MMLAVDCPILYFLRRCLSRQIEDLDGRCGQNGVFFNQSGAVGILQRGKGDEKKLTLGNEDDALIGIGGEEVGDRFNQ